MRKTKKFLVTMATLALLGSAAPVSAGPVDEVVDLYRDTTAPVWDLYDRKLGCGSSDPILCPGP